MKKILVAVVIFGLTATIVAQEPKSKETVALEKADKRITKLENTAELYQKGLLALIITALGGLGGTFLLAKKGVDTTVKKLTEQAETKFAERDEQLAGQFVQLMNLVDAASTEQRLIKTTPISVVSKDNRELLGRVQDAGFRGARTVTVEEAQDHGRKLLIIDGNTVSDQDIANIAKGLVADAFVVYKTTGYVDRKVVSDNRMNFANSPITLWSQVVTTLKYLNQLAA